MSNESANAPEPNIAALVNAGSAFWFAGKQKDALECYRQAAEMLPPDASPKVVVRVMSDYALALRSCGDTSKALVIYKDLESKLDPADPVTGNVLRQWAIALGSEGQYPQARALYDRIRPKADSSKDDRLKWHHAVGLLDWSEGRFRSALANLRTAKRLLPRASDQAAKVLAVLGSDALISLALGDVARAYRLVQRMVAIRARVESVPLESETNLAIVRASLAAHQKNHHAEAQIYREALDWLEQNAQDQTIHALDLMGRYVSALHHTGCTPEALQRLREMVEKAPASLAWVAGLNLASVEVDQGDLHAARHTLALVLAAVVGNGEAAREAEIIAVLASYCARAGKRDAAIFLGKLSVCYFAALLDPMPKDQIAAALGECKRISDLTAQVLRASGRYEEAQIVNNIFERMQHRAHLSRATSPSPRAIDIVPMDTTEKSAQVGWMLARQAMVEYRKAGDDAAVQAFALQVIDALADFETGSGLDHCYALLPAPPAGIVRLSVVPVGQHLSLQWQTDRLQRKQNINLPAEALYSLVADFREQLCDPVGWQETAQMLYDLIFAPLAEELRHAKLFEVDASGLLGRIPVWLVLARAEKRPTLPVRYVMGIPPPAGPCADRSDHLHANAIATGALADLASACGDTGTVLSGPGFTKDALLTRLQTRPASLSITAHYEIEPTRPELSALVLGDGEPLYLSEIVEAEIDLRGMTHVIAAACSSGQRDVTEGATLSLASLVLEKGAECFVGTLWDVPEFAAADFLQSFWAKRVAFPAMDIAEIVAVVQADALRRLHQQPIVSGRTGGIGTPSAAGSTPHWAAFAVYASCNEPQPCA